MVLRAHRLTGIIPACHRLVHPTSVLDSVVAFNERIRESELRTQNYDKGMGRFVRKFDPEVEMPAKVSVIQGHYQACEWAVCVTRDERRCFLLNTTFGVTKEESLWTSLSGWAVFQPRHAKRRIDLGQLFSPNEFSHVFEKRWDYLDCLDQHQNFAQESEYAQECMSLFSQGLSQMDAQSLRIRPSAEAKDEDVLFADCSRSHCDFQIAPDTGRSRLLGGAQEYGSYGIRWHGPN
jgi:hypothetical protein